MMLETLLEILKNQVLKIGAEAIVEVISFITSNIRTLEETGEISSVDDVLDYLDSLTQ